MKICITSKEDTINSEIDPRFGRCQYFLIIDTDTMNLQAISNESRMQSGGAGIQAAQKVAKTGVTTVITGNIGPNAFKTLHAANITVITGLQGSVSEALEKLKHNKLKETERPNVPNHFGTK